MFRFFALVVYFGASSLGTFSIQPQVLSGSVLCSRKKGGDADEDAPSHAFSVGTFVEFEEKTRVHVGKILESEINNGGARYEIEDNAGKQYHVADKAVNFAIPAPNSPAAASKLFDAFCKASEVSEKDLRAKLDISTELLKLAWERVSVDSSPTR